MKKTTLRAPAVPLITHDPMFSVWSFADKLTDDVPRHWTGVRQYIFGVLVLDGEILEFMGKVNANDARIVSIYDQLPQTGCEVRPMTTTYTFANDKVNMELRFVSPLLLNDLEVLARPVSYVDYKITANDGKEHTAEIIFGFSGELCVNEGCQKVTVGTSDKTLYFSSGDEYMLKRSADDQRIEWGEFHVVAPDYIWDAMPLRRFQRQMTENFGDKLFPVNHMASQGPRREQAGPVSYNNGDSDTVYPYYPTLIIRKKFEAAKEFAGGFEAAYNDFKSLQYFGENINAYWKKDGDSFYQMLHKAIAQKDEVLKKVYDFEEELLAKARKVSDKYADIISLAYRQAVAGHKLTYHDGEIQFVSKENYSNGCAATVDVTYPSVPLFLMYAPELVEGMLNPVFKMIDDGQWDFDFAPHDVGQYPLVNGQVYGYRVFGRRTYLAEFKQMPVEECGNMILCVAGICYAEKKFDYFLKYKDLMKKWADYLVMVGYNPENQLCTDDFAGHLAHNCNLSVKGICGVGALAKMLADTGDKEGAAYYRKEAEKMAAQWEEGALEGDHYRLTFDQPETWSLKYNMVWDKLLNLKLFSQKVYDLELAWYLKQVKPYGVPMDIRGDYTKSDWQMWSTRLFDSKEYTDAVVNTMWAFLNETPDRAPFTDLYFVSKPYMREFQARTVQGGLFINLLNF